jgi:Ca2+-binding RTX toxin-like protein
LERGFGDAGGNPVLEGTAGPDALAGTAGADGIRGGPGADTLVGGAGADTFLLAEGGGQDRVEDFERGIDRLLLEGGIDPASVWTQATALDGVQGRAVHYGWAGDMVFLAGVWELTGGDIAFA